MTEAEIYELNYGTETAADVIPKGLPAQAAWQEAKKDQGVIGEDLGEWTRSVVLDPIVDVPLNLLQLGSQATGIGEETAQGAAQFQYERDMQTWGPSVHNKYQVDPKTGQSLARDLPSYIIPSATLSLGSKIARGGLSATKKALGMGPKGPNWVKPNSLKTSAQGVSDDASTNMLRSPATSKFGPGRAKASAISETVKDAVKMDVLGTSGIAELYEVDPVTGEVKTADDAWKRFGAELAMNLAPTLAISAPGAIARGNTAKAAADRATAYHKAINSNETTNVNISEGTINNLKEDSKGRGKGIFDADSINMKTLSKMYKEKAWGVYQVSDGSQILVAQKTGAQRLYQRPDGTYYIKGKDGNYLMQDAVELRVGDKPLFEPISNEFAVEGGTDFGYNSISTSKIETISSEAAGGSSDVTKVYGASPEISSAIKGYGAQGTDAITPQGVVVKKRDLAADAAIKGYADNFQNIPAAITNDPTLNAVMTKAYETKNKVEEVLSEVSEGTRLGLNEAVKVGIDNFANNNKSGIFSDIVNSMFNKDSGNTMFAKDELTTIINRSVDNALTKMVAKVKKTDDGSYYLASGDIPDLAASIVEDIMQSSGVTKKGIDVDNFKAQLTDHLKDNGLGNEKIFGSKMKIKDVSGTTAKALMLTDAKHKLTTTGEQLFNNSATIADTVAKATDTVQNNINRLNAMTSGKKYSIDYSPSNKVSAKKLEGESVDQAMKRFSVRLDKDSLPLYIWMDDNGKINLGHDAKLYQDMANTHFYYAGGKKAATDTLDYVDSLNDLEAARYLDLITPEKYKQALEDGSGLDKAMTNKMSYDTALQDISSLREEATAHRHILNRYDHKNGMTFGVMKVSTNRMQYSGFINPQQGRLSETLFTATQKVTGDKIIEGYKSDGVRTALDNWETPLDTLTDAELASFGIPDRDAFNIKYWDASNETAVALGELLASKIEGNIDTKSMTTKELAAYRTIVDGVAKSDMTKIVAEYDGVTSMRGLTDMYMKITNAETGVGAPITKTNTDTYVRFGKELQAQGMFPFLDFSGSAGRTLAKDAAQPAGYGQGPTNIAISFVENFLLKNLREGNFEKIAEAANSVEVTSRFHNKDFKTQMEALVQKLKKLKKTEGMVKLLESEIRKDWRPGEKTLGIQRYGSVINTLDQLETLKVKMETSTLERFDELDAILMQTDSILVESFMKKVESDKFADINLPEVKAVARMSSKNKGTGMRNATRKAFGEDFIELQERTKYIFEKGYVHSRRIMENTTMTTQLANDMYKDLGIKPYDKKILNIEMRTNNIRDLWGFVEALSIKGHDVMTSKTLVSKLPYIKNGFGDKVLFVNNKNTGFHEASRMQYSGLSPITNALPFLLHSSDSSIMGIASGGKAINHRWDAMYGHGAHEQAASANNAVSWAFSQVNIFDSLKDSYINASRSSKVDGTAIGSDGMDAIYRDTARREIVGDGTIPTAEGIDFLAAEIKKRDADGSDKQLNLIMDGQKKLEDRSADINQNDSITTQQYMNGSPNSSTVANIADLKKDTPKYQTKTQDVQYRDSSFDLENLKNINTDDFTIKEMGHFEMSTISNPAIIEDITSTRKGLKGSYNDFGNTITLSKTSAETGFWREMTHEIVHQVGLKLYGAEFTAKEFGTISQRLQDTGFKLGYKADGDVVVFDKGLLESTSDISKIDVDVIYGNEISASMLDRLIANELVYANKKTVAKLSNRKDLTGEISPLSVVDSTGRVYDMYTVSDLTSFLEGQKIEGYTTLINEYASRVLGVVNGSTKIRDYIFNKKINKFETTLNKQNRLMRNLNKNMDKTNGDISQIPFLELFQLNPEKEALETALAKSKGVEASINSFVANLTDVLNKQFDQEFGGDAQKYANILGDSFAMGLNKLFHESMNGPGMQFMNLTTDSFKDGSGNLMTKGDINRVVNANVDKFARMIGSKSKDPSLRAAAQNIMNDIQALADGTSGYKVESVAGKLQALAKEHLSKEDFEFFNAKVAVQKLSSMHLLNKNNATFASIYDLMSRKPDVFDTYMKQANVHSNPYSLFGENMEMQFIEEGKTARIIPTAEAGKYSQSDIVATIKDSQGNEYTVVTMAASERFIGEQNSNLMTIEITDFEKGMFKSDDGKLILTGQNLITEGSHVDKGIVKQFARNAYVKKREDLNKDLAYRSWHMLRENNILMTANEMEAAKKASGSTINFRQLSDNNPFSKALGVKYYFNEKYVDYFEGTPGIDIRGASKSLAGDTEFAKFVEGAMLTASKTINMLKRFILVARPQSYINSMFSSFTIYATHATGVAFKKDWMTAKNSLGDFKSKMKEYTKIYASADRQAEAAKYWTDNLEGHVINKLMKAGLLSTMRADVYKLGTSKELETYGALRKATGSSRYANAFKSITLDETTWHGEKMAEMFDATELYPKLMLYFNRVNDIGHDKASQTVIMSFPTYNNLPAMLNIVDQVSPYTKFLASTPRMITYGINQSPKKMMAGVVMAQGITPASYAFASEEEKKAWEWHREAGFIKVPFADYSYASMSLFPIHANPFNSPFGTTAFDPTFVVSAGQSAFTPSSYIPGTSLPD